MIKNFLHIVSSHKIIVSIIIIVVAVGGYFEYRMLTGNSANDLYVLTSVRKGTFTATVSGSGQVITSDSLDIKPKTSGDIIYVGVTAGQKVRSGQLIAEIDPTDAQKAVSDAKTSLETAKLQLDNLLAPVDALTLLQAEDLLTQARESLQNSQNDLVSTYASAYTDISNAYIALPSVMTGLNSMLYSNTINKSQNNVDAYTNLINNSPSAYQFNQAAVSGYQAASVAYTQALMDFKNSNINSSTSTIEALLSETNNTLKAISVANSNIKNLLDLVSNTMQQANLKIPNQLNIDEASMQSYISTVNDQLSTILGVQNSIQSDKDSIVSAQRSINEKTLSLANIKAGPDDLTIRAAQIAVQQQQDNLTTAQQNLDYCYIRAPFDGVISKINVQKGDPVSSGTAVATIITEQQMAQLSLNEVDAAKVQIGQAATMTFDAIPNLTVDGQVSELDAAGTVSQGVVTYNLQIAFNKQNNLVKPGMTVTAVIVTENRPNVLLIPSSAIKKVGNRNYVLVPSESDLSGLSATSSPAGVSLKNSPVQKEIQIGPSNSILTEVLSGLSEGDKIILRTITTSQAVTTSTQSNANLLRGLTGGAGGFIGGGTFRTPAGGATRMNNSSTGSTAATQQTASTSH
ncbi:MAG: efflux RND transporter periplasmic adaptor subunit [Patescibacteria group bacterium]|nr:efflux RND transporter periplasmic adaptor subunit [Patescibacteria group bacterium]